MVQIGTIEYEARVSNVDEAQANAQDFAESHRDVGEAAEGTAGSVGLLAGTFGSAAVGANQAGEEADEADTEFTLLRGTVGGVTRAFGRLFRMIAGGTVLSTITGGVSKLAGVLSGLTLSGILGSVTGAISSFVGWLAAGSAGALAVAGAIGAVIGLFGVWILEITGVLDWIGELGNTLANALPDWARDGVLAVIGWFAGPLAVIGGFIVGFIEGGFDEAFARAGEVIDIFFGAFKRTFDRIAGVVGSVADWIGRQFNRAVSWVMGQLAGLRQFFVNVGRRIQTAASDAAGWFETKWQDAVNFVSGIVTGLRNTVDRIFGRIGDAVSGAADTLERTWRGAKNAVVGFLQTIDDWVDTVMGALQGVIDRAQRAADQVRDVSPVGGPGGGASDEGLVPWTGFPVDVPFAQSGGRVGQTGLAVVHEGEQIIPPGPSMAMRSGGGGGGTTVDVDTIHIELDGDFDPSDVSRRDLDSLADRLVDLIGDKTNRRAGVR